MSDYSHDQFDVDLRARKVLHRKSGIWFQFYEYTNETDWQKSDTVMYHDNPRWPGDRDALAAEAKHAAIKGGMKAAKSSH